MKTPRILPLSLLAAGLATAQLQADVVTWTGDDPTNPSYFGDADNWTPAGFNFQDYGVFETGTSQKTIEMVFSNGTSLYRSGVEGANFEDAGWIIQDTVGDGSGGWRYDFNGAPASIDTQPYGINSSGAGINEIRARFEFASANGAEIGQARRPITVNTGNTLLFSGDFANAQAWTLQGDGTMIINNGTANRTNAFNAGLDINDSPTLLVRGSFQISGASNASTSTLLDEGTIGGDGIINVRSGTDIVFEGTTLAPGGNGTTEGGAAIGSLTWQSGLDTTAARLSLTSGTTLEMDIGNGGPGNNDQLLLNLKLTDSGGTGFLDIESGVTLNIVGTLIQDGAYTLISNLEDTEAITGTFTTVNFNGVAINPANFTLDYNSDSVVVNVTGLIPEPSTYALIFGSLLGMIIMIKRRR